MSRPWEQWERQVVNGAIHLGRYLGGGERSAVFFTEDVQRDPQKAVIKLVAADSESAELQLSRWELAARLSHPHLMRLFRMGHCKIGDTELLYAVMECAEENLSQVLLERPHHISGSTRDSGTGSGRPCVYSRQRLCTRSHETGKYPGRQ
jgi:hypothetical protein